MLAWGEDRCNPKEQAGAAYTEGYHVDTADAMCHGILSDRCHQSPSGAGQKHAYMRNEWSFVVHCFVFLTAKLIKS